MAGQWEVYSESASYWDVGERADPPAGEPEGTLAWIPVCRVRKNAGGKERLARILALPQIEAALREMKGDEHVEA